MLRRAVLAVFLGAVAVLVGVSSARGADAFYLVTGFGDSGGSCAPYPNVPGAFTCTTLRAAVAAADADAASDSIYLQPGNYTLSSTIDLATDVAIFGGNARTTQLQLSGTGRLISVEAGADVTIYGLTLTGGNVATLTGEGGAILNAGTLLLWETRVFDNQAPNGGGIANADTGDLQVLWSLIDHNQTVGIDGPTGSGGGILNHGILSIEDSTIALNSAGSAGGISSVSSQLTTLTHVTVAGNDTGATNPAGVSFDGPWSAYGSLFAANAGDSPQSNCGGVTPSGSGNIADDSTCEFGTGGDGATGLPGPLIQLVDRGGMTDVVDIAGTPAKGFEAACTTPYDQRLGQRQFNGPCDAGAYEEGVPAGAITPLFPIPTPTASPATGPTPTPVATPTPTPVPTPVAGKTVVAKSVKGTVKVRLPGTNTFVELDGTQGVPVGATVDTKQGTVQLTSVLKKGGKLQSANFFDGIFKLGQTKTTTDLTLTEKLAACAKRGKKASAAAKKKPKSRRLWGDGKGAFRTRGQYSAATVRGTKWLVQDSCAGTLTRVTKGVVNVRDNVRRKTIIVRAGHRYLAKPRR